MRKCYFLTLFIVYIKGMCDEEKKFDGDLESFTSSEIVLGCIIPFVLFGGGILTPIFWDSIYIWLLSIVPYYSFVWFGLILSKKNTTCLLGFSVLMSFSTSILLAVLLFLIPENWQNFLNVCRLGLLNLIPSFLVLILALVCIHLGKDKENFPWFLIPFFW